MTLKARTDRYREAPPGLELRLELAESFQETSRRQGRTYLAETRDGPLEERQLPPDASDPWLDKAEALERGEELIVPSWQVPMRLAPHRPYGQYMRIEKDGSLSAATREEAGITGGLKDNEPITWPNELDTYPSRDG